MKAEDEKRKAEEEKKQAKEEENRRKHEEKMQRERDRQLAEAKAKLEEEQALMRKLRVERWNPEGNQASKSVALIAITFNQPIAKEEQEITDLVQHEEAKNNGRFRQDDQLVVLSKSSIVFGFYITTLIESKTNFIHEPKVISCPSIV